MKSVKVPIQSKHCLKFMTGIPKSTLKIFNKSQCKKDAFHAEKSSNKIVTNHSNCGEFRENNIKVQMISKNLHKQIFRNFKKPPPSNDVEAHKQNLRNFGISIEKSDVLPDIELKMPLLRGENIEDHFRIIAKKQLKPYEELMGSLMNCRKFPLPPLQWEFREGWTQYNTHNNKCEKVDYPMEDSLILDVEVCVSAGSAPSLATAVGTQYWYSWVSPQFFRYNNENHISNYYPEDMIPLGKKRPTIIVGHNVSYDRARIREQYFIEDTLTRFIDTMSLHICVSGVTSSQRAIISSRKETSPNDASWIQKSSLNNLSAVYKLYCKGEIHSKDSRDTFVKGSLNDVRNDFQNLMSYCANDVIITKEIFVKLFPQFLERFPHPVTLAGMLELGSAYLPVNSNWLRYINESNLSYDDLNIETKNRLSKLANESCQYLIKEEYKKNVWLWNEDWNVEELNMKKSCVLKRDYQILKTTKTDSCNADNDDEFIQQNAKHYEKFHELYEMKAYLPARRPLLPGYPAWYRKLCRKPPLNRSTNCGWSPGPTEIGTGMQIVPKLLSLCWEGFPLHYTKEQGWGFLVPFQTSHTIESKHRKIPIKHLLSRFGSKLHVEKCKYMSHYKGSGIWCNTTLEDCCYFIKLPHKKGSSFRVGNPLSKDFLNKFSENVLSCGSSDDISAERIIQLARMMSYWRNNRDRITKQLIVWLPSANMENLGKKNEILQGAICPQIVVCGTLTRRAMEPTWMTASNSQTERIGSELRAMVQAPKSYKIVGADVDSQELWIASVLGDAYSSGIHGATPLGWMTLSGSKTNGTDMHSITANTVGISREHAKVLNYARIYGAGQNFAEAMLRQFNSSISVLEAKDKAIKMFSITKGRKIYEIKKKYRNQYKKACYSGYDAAKIASTCNCNIDDMFYKPSWLGGTESAMFNCLEDIASEKRPITPFLSGRLSRPLEGEEGKKPRFFPTRVNWVVQSGAVDFLHLMIVSMRWLMGSKVRFCLSFHDELRYLAKDELAYKAALAMHVTNLLARSFCSSRLGIHDLPMSVAFFSSVEVDTVLRKECTLDCITPSNPHGLRIGYGISHGESLNIYKAIEKSGGGDLTQWDWID